VMARNEFDDLERSCGAAGTCTDAQVQTVHTRAVIADIGLATGIVGAAAGTLLLFVGPGAARDPRQHDDRVSFRVAPVVLPRAAFITTELRF